MCLQTTQKDPLIAKRDIICYKLVEKSIETDKYRSFYLYSPVELNTYYYSKLINEYACSYYNKINFGLHSFTSKKQAIKYAKRASLFPNNMGEIIKCIIPAGSEYYKGKTDNNFSSYASNAIYYTNEIIYKF